MRRLIVLLLVLPGTAVAAGNLENISFASLPGDKVEIRLEFSGPAPEDIGVFTIDNPARIAIDLPNVGLKLKQRFAKVNLGAVRNVAAAQANDRTRVVVSLTRLIGYETRTDGKRLLLTMSPSLSRQQAARTAASPASARPAAPTAPPPPVFTPAITDLDFRRGPAGEGRVIVRMNTADVDFNMSQRGDELQLDIAGAPMPARLAKVYDVIDFATPITRFEARRKGEAATFTVNMTGEYEHLAYQADNTIVIEARPLTPREVERKRREEFTGEKLSLNFQDIEVRSVLQLLADFTDLNIVVSDSVTGNLTLRLKNVPWDQALDIILKTKNLDRRQNGNVIYIAPADEIATREQLELESQKKVEELAPLYSEYIQINYAYAGDLADLLKNPENSFLTERGSVSVDQRTNTLLLRDTDQSLDQIRKLIERLDIAVKQVLIESRIVVASDDFSKELGARFGFSNFDAASNPDSGDTSVITGDGLAVFERFADGEEIEIEDTLQVNLPVANPTGRLGLVLSKLPLGILLDLEISAAQAESRAEIVSSPKLLTSNQAKAVIKQGVEIPFQEATSSGATNVEFKEAVLSLEVTPQITPDNRVSMALKITQDTIGAIVPTGLGGSEPSIDTREIVTQVLVNNGQTVVLGGIYEHSSTVANRRVPFFGELPLVGRLFRTDMNDSEKSELLIFITPKIVSETLELQ